MSPRHNRRRDNEPSLHRGAALGSAPSRVSASDGEWLVRVVVAGTAIKTYRCPGCAGEIGPATAHVVAWPGDELGGPEDRRHWHRGCWQARQRRRPIG
ncbi:MAG: ATP/GTP-binding protein [Mycobacteriales bacterium]